MADIALGVAGLAGLFKICQEAIEKFKAYRHFENESRNIMTVFDVDKLRYRKWAEYVGFADNELNDKHHASLDDGEVAWLISRILSIIQEILNNTAESSTILQLEREINKSQDSTSLSGSLYRRPIGQIPHSASVSKRFKLSWAVGKKLKFSEQVNNFGVLVEKLYSVVPIEDGPLRGILVHIVFQGRT